MRQHEALILLAALGLVGAYVSRRYLSRDTQTLVAAVGLANSLATLFRGER